MIRWAELWSKHFSPITCFKPGIIPYHLSDAGFASIKIIPGHHGWGGRVVKLVLVSLCIKSKKEAWLPIVKVFQAWVNLAIKAYILGFELVLMVSSHCEQMLIWVLYLSFGYEWLISILHYVSKCGWCLWLLGFINRIEKCVIILRRLNLRRKKILKCVLVYHLLTSVT